MTQASFNHTTATASPQHTHPPTFPPPTTKPQPHPRNHQDNIHREPEPGPAPSDHHHDQHRPNEPFGDLMTDLSTGNMNHAAEERKRKDIFRVYFQNINGLSAVNDGTHISETFQQIQSTQASAFGFAETNLATDQPRIKRLINSKQREIWEHSKIITAQSNFITASDYKPGGVLIGVTNDIVGRVHNHFSDHLGRWTGVSLSGKANKHLVIITAYQVVNNQTKHGARTAYKQQCTLLRQENISNPNPRKQFISDLKQVVQEHHRKGNDIILMGDFNEEVGIEPGGVQAILATTALVDAHFTRHGDIIDIPTYARGRKRLDYMFISKTLVPSLAAAGLEPFNNKIHSDHRGMYIDLFMQGLFDHSPTPLETNSGRGVRSHIPGHVCKYLEATEKYLAEHKCYERMSTLNLSTDNHVEAEKLDRDITAAMLHGDQKCKTFNRHPWSPELHRVVTSLHIMKLFATQLTTRRDMTRAIQQKQQELTERILPPLSIEETKRRLREFQKDLRNIVISKKAQRKTRLADRMTAFTISMEGKMSTEKAEGMFKRAQETKSMFQNLPTTKAKGTGGLTAIKLPAGGELVQSANTGNLDDSHQWMTVNDPTIIEQQLLRRNQLHFRQADRTPLATRKAEDEITFAATSETADRLLQGTEEVERLTADKWAQDILRSCKEKIPEVESDLTVIGIKKKFRMWRVTTSTSPSNRHLDHYHALMNPDGLDETKPHKRHMKTVRENIWKMHFEILQYAVSNGHCFERWQQVVNTLIEKDQGDPKIHRLRVIHLMEADYSLLMGHYFRKVMHTSEDKQLLNPGCYGSRANRSAHDPIILEVLQREYSMVTRTSQIKFSNDATSCFDRILPPLANLISRSYGLPKDIAQIHGDMLQKAVYRLKTKLGISEGHYSHSATSPVFGTGQGSTASPMIWGLIVSTLFDIFDKSGHGAKFSMSDASNTLRLGMTGFFDDNTLQILQRAKESLADMCKRCEHDAQIWHNLLWASGGDLEISKCLYQFLTFDFKPDGTPTVRKGNHGARIQIQNSEKQPMTIRQIPADEEYKLLGTYQAANHQQEQQFQTLLKKSHQHAKTISLSSVSRKGAWIYYQSCFLPSVGYPLPTCHMTEQQLHQLQSKMMATTLSKMGFPRVYPHAVTFGAINDGGLGFHDLRHEQGVQAVSHVIRLLRSDHQTRQMMLITLERAQALVGTKDKILHHPEIPLPQLEGFWLPSIRKFLKNIGAQLQIADIPVAQIQRINDKYIMEVVREIGHFTPIQIRRINYCRLYLNIITMSDMCSAEGKHLIKGIHEGIHHSDQRRTKTAKIRQQKPDTQTWNVWRSFLNRIVEPSRKGRKKLRTKWIMGAWFRQNMMERSFWKALYHPSTRKLYIRKKKKYTIHRLRQRAVAEKGHLESVDRSLVPKDSIPVDITPLHTAWRLPATVEPLILPWTPPASTFESALGNQPSHLAIITKNFKWVDCRDLEEFCEITSNLSTIIIVTDGGVRKKNGTFGWIISTRRGRRLASGMGPVQGSDINSYRAEATGVKAAVHFVQKAHIHNKSKMTGELLILLDNIGVVQKLNSIRKFYIAEFASAKDPEWDIINSCIQSFKSLPEQPVVEHILGHQDNKLHYWELSLNAQLNVDADGVATEAFATYKEAAPLAHFDPKSKVQLNIKHRTITSEYTKTLRAECNRPRLLAYYAQRHQWQSGTHSKIDWETFGTIYRHFHGRRQFYNKFCFRQLPTGKRLHRRTPKYDERCLSCSQEVENDEHLLTCKCESRKTWRRHLLEQIRKAIEHHTDPVLMDILHQGLALVFSSSATKGIEPLDYSTTYRSLIREQNEIGWYNFLAGKMSVQWKHQQQEYWRRTKRKPNRAETKWTTKLLKTIWTQLHEMWLQRCSERHGPDKETRSSAQAELTKRTIRSLYALKDQCLHEDQHIFYETADAHLQQNNNSLRHWVELNQSLITYSVRQAKNSDRRNTKKINTYFRPSQRQPRQRQKTTTTEGSKEATTKQTHITTYINTHQPMPSDWRITQPKRAINQRPTHITQTTLHDAYPDHPG